MGADDGWITVPPETAAMSAEREDHWRHFDNSVDAVSFGFVATAILISMFLVMAIFERFLRPRSSLNPSPRRPVASSDVEAQFGFNGKVAYPSPKMTMYAKGVTVLMPGEHVPTYLAHPAPAPCPPDRDLRPFHPTRATCPASSRS
ncbi:hypothetical protein LINPERPRIM_LOCUS3452 [Linum perenne]